MQVVGLLHGSQPSKAATSSCTLAGASHPSGQGAAFVAATPSGAAPLESSVHAGGRQEQPSWVCTAAATGGGDGGIVGGGGAGAGGGSGYVGSSWESSSDEGGEGDDALLNLQQVWSAICCAPWWRLHCRTTVSAVCGQNRQLCCLPLVLWRMNKRSCNRESAG